MKTNAKSQPRLIADGRHLKFVEINGWEYVQRRNCTGVVVIVAVTDDSKMLFVEQYRPPVASQVIELPAGLAGDIIGAEDEALATAAKRELMEETGFEASSIELLIEGPASAGLSDEMLTFVRATGLRRTGPGGGDQSEDIRVHLVPLDQVPGWIDQRRHEGALIDSKVFAGLFFAGAAFSLPG